MKKILLALAAATAFAGAPAQAQVTPGADPQASAAVKSLFDAMDARKMMLLTYAEMEKAMPEMMRAQFVSLIEGDASLNAQQKKEALARLEKTMPRMLASLNALFRDPTLIDELVNEMVPVYANNFTLAEIRELSAFYATPVGRKTIAVMPRIAADTMEVSQRLLMPRVNAIMQEFVQDIQKQ